MALTIVTGSNTGIGRVTAEQLARDGHTVILACRSREKTEPVLASIREHGGNAEFLGLDLADLDQVQKAARTLLERGEPVGALINNAGLAGSRGTTAQGFELTFGVNHLGTYLWTRLLLPLLRASEAARVVTVASKAHYEATRLDWSAFQRKTRSLTGLREYERSKLCNVLFASELARRERGVLSVSLHPGVVASDIWRQIPWPIRPIMLRNMISNEEGAQTSLHCARTPDLAAHNGGYFDRSAPKKPSALAQDETLAGELWTRSEEWVSRWLS